MIVVTTDPILESTMLRTSANESPNYIPPPPEEYTSFTGMKGPFSKCRTSSSSPRVLSRRAKTKLRPGRHMLKKFLFKSTEFGRNYSSRPLIRLVWKSHRTTSKPKFKGSSSAASSRTKAFNGQESHGPVVQFVPNTFVRSRRSPCNFRIWGRSAAIAIATKKYAYQHPGVHSKCSSGFENLDVRSPSNHTALQCVDPQMSWRPPSAVHSDAMRREVQADEASLETGLQMKREVRIVDALSQPPSIPESPTEPVETYNDRYSPQIPLEPVNEGELLDESLVHVRRNWSWNNKADVQAAATAACAALSEYYHIDNASFKQIVSNPTLIQSLTTSKWPSATTTNARPDISSSINFKGVSRLPDEIDEAKDEWINPPSKSNMSLAAGGNEEHESTSSQFHVSAVNRFHKTQASEDMHLLPGALDDRHLFTSPTNGGSVGRRQVPSPSIHSEGPPRFGRSKPNSNDIRPPSFSGKCPSHAGGQAAAVETVAGDGFHKTQDSEDMHVLPGALDDRHLFTSPRSGGKVGRRQVPSPSIQREGPPGYGSSKPHGNDIIPPCLSRKSPSPAERQAAAVETAAGDGFHKTQGSEDIHLLPGALDDRQLFTSPTSGGKVGRRQVPKPSVQSEGPPGFGRSKPNGNDIMPPSFSGKSPSQVGGQAAVETAAGDGFHKTQASEDMHLLPGALDDRQLFTSPTIGGKVGRRQVPKPSLCSESPAGFGRSKPNGHDIKPPGFSGKSPSPAGGQAAAVGTAAGDRFHKTHASEDTHLLPGASNDRHLFKSPTIDEKVGRTQVPRPSIQSESPPGFGTSKPNGNDIMPPNFSGKSPSQVVGLAAEVETAAPHFKPWKTCHYFGTARGCRNGDNCRFLHEVQDSEKNTQNSSRGNTQNLGRAPTKQLRVAKRPKGAG